MQRKVGDLIIKTCNLGVQSVYCAKIEFVGFLQLIIERLQICDLIIESGNLIRILVLIRLQDKHLIRQVRNLSVKVGNGRFVARLNSIERFDLRFKRGLLVGQCRYLPLIIFNALIERGRLARIL